MTIGSTLASSTCPGLAADAWTLGAGSHTLNASATDKAGNTTSTSATFDIRVDPRDLCALTLQFVQGSPGYNSMSPVDRLRATATAALACVPLLLIRPSDSPQRVAALVASYDATVDVLVSRGWLVVARAAVLHDLARSI